MEQPIYKIWNSFEKEMAILDEKFASGEIGRQEYDESVKLLERDMNK